jgi:hypothetical protein
MGHCLGRKGTENYDVDTFKALTERNQSGEKPDQLIAARYQTGEGIGKRLVMFVPASRCVQD